MLAVRRLEPPVLAAQSFLALPQVLPGVPLDEQPRVVADAPPRDPVSVLRGLELPLEAAQRLDELRRSAAPVHQALPQPLA